MLDRIKSHRRTAILPQQTGPVIDVLYSAAGNSADEAYYSNGIIGFDFEIGAQHFNDTGSGPATCNPGQQPPFGTNTTNPCLLNEGFHEAMEFASGNYGLLNEALDVLQRHHGADRRRRVDAGQRLARLEVRRGVHERRGGLDLLHDRRLDADDGLDGVQAAAGAGAAASRSSCRPARRSSGSPTTSRATCPAVRSQKFIPHVNADGTVTGTVPATLSLAVNPSTTFGAFTPGVTRTYLTSLGAHRDLDGR